MRRAKDIVVAFLLLLSLAFIAAWLSKQGEITIEGMARVIDGDSLVLDGSEIRLIGIDAPELDQPCESKEKDRAPPACGELARRHLRSLIANQVIVCNSSGEDRYGRLLAQCGYDEVMINRRMVQDGYAVARDDFFALEREARSAKRGLWKHGFENPARWRRDRQETEEGGWFWSLF